VWSTKIGTWQTRGGRDNIVLVGGNRADRWGGGGKTRETFEKGQAGTKTKVTTKLAGNECDLEVRKALFDCTLLHGQRGVRAEKI